MDVLVSGHAAGDDPATDALARARRTVPYQRLVLLSTNPGDPSLGALRRAEAEAGVAVRVAPIPGGELLRVLKVARSVLAEEARPPARLRVHVAGAGNLVAHALTLAAFEQGVEAFVAHPRGVSWLPVAVAVEVRERFTPGERLVLAALREVPREWPEVAEETGLALGTVRGAALQLRAAGLAGTEAGRGWLTPAGKLLQTSIR